MAGLLLYFWAFVMLLLPVMGYFSEQEMGFLDTTTT